ncbi:hypothetical protein FACS189434_07590 [Bacteroidia bacterium]|nr:hypothetical protein FACS189434_07590 [Bacteroidia bacterium]
MFLYSQYGKQVTFSFGPEFDWNICKKYPYHYFDTICIYPETTLKDSVIGKMIDGFYISKPRKAQFILPLNIRFDDKKQYQYTNETDSVKYFQNNKK